VVVIGVVEYVTGARVKKKENSARECLCGTRDLNCMSRQWQHC
jgi:hypothetical protein